MARLLDHSLPDVAGVNANAIDPVTGQPQFIAAVQRAIRDIEMALTKMDFPAEVEGKDDSKALTWFI
jgi:hypothetical protein|tara:strand:+ start:5386 stop:5586 length:201 start_codon:yes stop_codon:yes gene_type:complete